MGNILFGFALLDCFIILLNALTILIPFLSFNGTTNAYLLYKSITNKKYLIPLFFLLNNCMSAKSTPHILSLNCEYTFLLLNFLITGLRNSSAKILLTSFVRSKELGFAVCFALALPEKVFLSSGGTFESKNFYTIPS